MEIFENQNPNQKIILINKNNECNSFNSKAFKQINLLLNGNELKYWCYFMQFKNGDIIKSSLRNTAKELNISKTTLARVTKDLIQYNILELVNE